MATKFLKSLKNPAHGGIFCFRHLLAVLCLLPLFFAAQPRLAIKDNKKNFGFVKKGEIIRLEYEITNTGDQPLVISDAEVSCSCTTVLYPKQPLLPGQHEKIVVSFDTKTVYNRQDRIVLINSNDPRGQAKLRYKGVVLKS